MDRSYSGRMRNLDLLQGCNPMGILGTPINPLDFSPVVVCIDNITSNRFEIMLHQKIPLLSQTNRTLFNRSILLLALRILLRNKK